MKQQINKYLDITVKNTVPYVRDLMNNVLIDIPYFMRCVTPSHPVRSFLTDYGLLSRHKDRMIEAVSEYEKQFSTRLT